MENSIGPRRSPMEILGMDRGWVRNECGPDWRIGHGYDSYHGKGGMRFIHTVAQKSVPMFACCPLKLIPPNTP